MSMYLIISGIIVFLGIVGFFYFASRNNYRKIDAVDKLQSKNGNISHYEEMRDELTFRDDIEQTEEKESSGGGGMSLIQGIISITIVMIIFFQVLMPTLRTVQSQVNTTGTPLSTPVDSMFNIIPIMVVVGIIFIVLNIFGLDRWGSSDEEPKKSRKKEKKMNKNIKHYTNKRDDLTRRKPKIKESEEEDGL